ncbi:hypothetical protein EI94DRAFT_1035513 [Lactarius quietus]|nr:hypothetical protein EI94DRAFT_1035513 [Lactarius quietus]
MSANSGSNSTFTGHCGGIGSQACQCAGATESSVQRGVCQCGHALQRHELVTRRCATINEMFRTDDHPSVSNLYSLCVHCGETYGQHDLAPRLPASLNRVMPTTSTPITLANAIGQNTQMATSLALPRPPSRANAQLLCLPPRPAQLPSSSQSVAGRATPFYPPGPSRVNHGIASPTGAATPLPYSAYTTPQTLTTSTRALGKRKRAQGRTTQLLDSLGPIRYDLIVVVDCQALYGDCPEAGDDNQRPSVVHPPTLTKMGPFLHRAKQEHLAFDYMVECYPDALVSPTLSSHLAHFFHKNGISVPQNKYVEDLINLAKLEKFEPLLFEILVCKQKGSRGRLGTLQIGTETGFTTRSLTYEKMANISKRYCPDRSQIVMFIVPRVSVFIQVINGMAHYCRSSFLYKGFTTDMLNEPRDGPAQCWALCHSVAAAVTEPPLSQQMHIPRAITPLRAAPSRSPSISPWESGVWGGSPRFAFPSRSPSPPVYQHGETPMQHNHSLIRPLPMRSPSPSVHQRGVTPMLRNPSLIRPLPMRSPSPSVHQRGVTPMLRNPSLIRPLPMRSPSPSVHQRGVTPMLRNPSLIRPLPMRSPSPSVHQRGVTPMLHNPSLIRPLPMRSPSPSVHQRGVTPILHNPSLIRPLPVTHVRSPPAIEPPSTVLSDPIAPEIPSVFDMPPSADEILDTPFLDAWTNHLRAQQSHNDIERVSIDASSVQDAACGLWAAITALANNKAVPESEAGWTISSFTLEAIMKGRPQVHIGDSVGDGVLRATWSTMWNNILTQGCGERLWTTSEATFSTLSLRTHILAALITEEDKSYLRGCGFSIRISVIWGLMPGPLSPSLVLYLISGNISQALSQDFLAAVQPAVEERIRTWPPPKVTRHGQERLDLDARKDPWTLIASCASFDGTNVCFYLIPICNSH